MVHKHTHQLMRTYGKGTLILRNDIDYEINEKIFIQSHGIEPALQPIMTTILVTSKKERKEGCSGSDRLITYQRLPDTTTT